MSPFITYFALLVFFIYGVTASSLMSFPRMIVAVRFGKVAQALVYCPVCSGFWVALILWACGWWPGIVAARGADALECVACSVAFIHITTTLLSSRGFLVAPALEQQIVDEARTAHEAENNEHG